MHPRATGATGLEVERPVGITHFEPHFGGKRLFARLAIRGFVEDSGEGRWTVLEAIDRGVPAPALALALFSRFRSRQEDSFRDRVIAALRAEFGGHAIKGK